MTVMINGYEVEIKAKYTANGTINDARFNKGDAMSVINMMCIWASEAAERYDRIGCTALSRQANIDYRNMNDKLEESGYFKNL